jgi:phosphoenolpyruvate phosphomutase
MEAHNGLSAKIVQETGFKGIWASGLSISAALGVRDNNEASWTQVLEVCEFMADASEVPILLDGDTGYGNFNNMRRLVRKLEQRGIAAVCIEDKLFPKTNSFINGDKQPLADIDEFALKIKAAKEGQTDPDFSVVARLEAFIAGWGLDEMLTRAKAYHLAGADALLIHSKKSSPDQILAFAKAWQNRCPLVIVPTMYYSTPVEVFEEAGISLVIWANHNVRSAINAMQETSRRIFTERSLTNVEDEVVSVKEVFRLQDAAELAEAEDRYLPQRAGTSAIIMAATRGDELHELTAERPKTMVPVNGRPILHHLVSQFRKENIKHVTVIRGFGKEHVNAPDVRFIDNDRHESTGELYTLSTAAEQLDGEAVISFGDILFRRYILSSLLEIQDDIAIAVDGGWVQPKENQCGFQDLVRASSPASLNYSTEPVWLSEMGPNLDTESVSGEWIGLLRTSQRGTELIKTALAELGQRDDFAELHLYHLLNHLATQGHQIRVVYIAGHWLDVDNLDDLAKAQSFQGS